MSLLLPKSVLQTIALTANSIVIGAPIWVFFVQAPSLLSFMGRDKFLPPMMRLTKVLFRWTLPLAAGVVCLCDILMAATDSHVWQKSSTKFAGLALIAVLINSLVIVPKALAAGAQASLKKTNAKPATTANFAVSGGDVEKKSVTKTLHQSVVVFVTVMLVGSVGYVHCVVNEI